MGACKRLPGGLGKDGAAGRRRAMEEGMGIRTILVPLDGSDASKPALETAFMVGRDLGAYARALPRPVAGGAA